MEFSMIVNHAGHQMAKQLSFLQTGAATMTSGKKI
jgi:hypothetical protein